jgi:amino acid transporter, AAT family
VRMPFFPGMQIAGLVLLVAVLITMGLDKDVWRISWIVGAPWLMLVSAGYFIWKARLDAAARARELLAGRMVDAEQRGRPLGRYTA